jgi:glycerate 2-kinase
VPRSSLQLRTDAQRIWWAGVEAVRPERLIRQQVCVAGNVLHVGDEPVDLRHVGRIAIVGAGKASGAMAVALEDVLGAELLAEKQVEGWVNVPADCLLPTQRVRLHAARPAGVNEPRPEGVAGTDHILKLIGTLQPDDLCFCVLSGGGSALLPAPVAEISLDDTVGVTRLLSAAGADIRQLNTVRRPLSRVKGGGLAHACGAGQLISLIISDVLGDALEDIASGPTVPSSTTAGDALAVLAQFGLADEPGLSAIVRFLRHQQAAGGAGPAEPRHARVTNLVIGNNRTAVEAAGAEAARLGYNPSTVSADRAEGPAEEVGRHLAGAARHMRDGPGADCLISGGEPTVRLVDESRRGRGGRNQQVALAALEQLDDCAGIALLSGGTDGEDGPTDAAGAIVTAEVVHAAHQQQLQPQEFLQRNDAYRFFSAVGGLFVTGSTQTNVCDLRVVAIEKEPNV